MKEITGTFEVELHHEPPYDERDGVLLGRTRVEKRFDGPLDAASTVHMIYARVMAEGAGGYVAIERVEGTLDGRKGSFVMQHSGTMVPSGQTLQLTVVPATGTGALRGLRGEMKIRIVEGQHYYDFAYAIDD